MQNRYKRHSYIDKVCIECGKEFQSQRTTRMYCGSACLQSYRNKRLAGTIQAPDKQIEHLHETNIVKPIQQTANNQAEQYFFNRIMQMRDEIHQLQHQLRMSELKQEFEQKLRELKRQQEEELEKVKNRDNEIQTITGIAQMIMPELIHILKK
jgi:hypothetical protein